MTKRKPRPQTRKYPEETIELGKYLWTDTPLLVREISRYLGIPASTIQRWFETIPTPPHRVKKQQNSIVQDPCESVKIENAALKKTIENLENKLAKIEIKTAKAGDIMALSKNKIFDAILAVPQKINDLASVHREMRETLEYETAANTNWGTIAEYPIQSENYAKEDEKFASESKPEE